ncbi:tetratricopeptide repeat protein [Flavobacterium sp.]|uniref:tetratricopeptide repeat protein n=1 Tax=Flavobacterium sp. TaxID=239 RepID=UPI003D0D298F
MNKNKIFSIAFLALGASAFAQDVESAKKAIDAEQYEKAKSILKSVIKSNPDNGKASFLLGNVYLRQTYQDSAKAVFQSALTKKDGGVLNYIGLGQLDLDNGNAQAAQFNFDQATANMKKKDIEQFVYIGKAYVNSVNPNATKAIEVLDKAKAINPTDAQLQLAIGDAYCLALGQGKSSTAQNDAYAAYRNALAADATLLRAKLQQAVLLKGAKAFDGAKSNLEQLIAENPNYGPAYRELAETYVQLALNSDKSKFKDLVAKAMPNYQKYMSLTDYSLATRMRFADFLVYTKDYAALEKEANEMAKLDKVNPRIMRYLGYASFENGNYAAAVDALHKYVSNTSNRTIGRDYLYLGVGQIKQAIPASAEGVKPVISEEGYNAGVSNLAKAVSLDPVLANELNEIGKVYFERKLYKYAAGIYEVAVSDLTSKNYLYDNFFLGYSLYFNNIGAEVKSPDMAQLQKADKAFAVVTTKSPTTQDAHIYRARVNSLLTEATAKTQMATSYEDYVKVILGKGGDLIEKNKGKLVESYNELARYYGKTDKLKANDYVSKSLALDPTDKDALNLKNVLK